MARTFSLARIRCRLITSLAATLAVALALAACGGHTATRKDVIARGDAICFATLQSIHSVAPPASTTSLAQLGRYFHRVLPLVRKQAAQLRALPRPAAGRALLERFIRAQSSAADAYAALAAAASRHDRAGVGRALSRLRANPAARLGRRYGLRQCGGSVATGP